ncbi:transglutaminase-like domain-containing protein [Halosquirtibacter xylanolyticus]|uniref:transglutaminase-like domain-containing protein n=1 Tax=Halosquirtibacter xylanolyticus TaxID=3374599 RepID=UPI003748602B|nr:transglutaminase-like domain-containing protein [Prolixibacteraceae bacterium]
MKRYITFIVLLSVISLFESCNPFNKFPEAYRDDLQQAVSQAGDNAIEIETALDKVPSKQKEAMAYLVSYMPQMDLDQVKADYLLKNVDLAYQARSKYNWAKEIPDSIFFNDVVPYASINEHRDDWRKDFMDRFSNFITPEMSMKEAIYAVNKNAKKELGVAYNTNRWKPDQSPYESMQQSRATCTGLSVLLIDAFRAVGIPARFAGTYNWFDDRGNHSWVEVWLDGQWYFTEYYFEDLDKAWFLSDAGKANPNEYNHAIFATSWKPRKDHFPAVWNENIKWIHAENVTDRYLKVYQKSIEGQPLKEDEVMLRVVLLKTMACSDQSDARVARQIDLYHKDKIISSGQSPDAYDDLNNFLKFKVKKNQTYTFTFPGTNGEPRSTEFKATAEKDQMVRLYQSEE